MDRAEGEYVASDAPGKELRTRVKWSQGKWSIKKLLERSGP